MKIIEMKNMEVVFAGEPWTHSVLPCAKQAIPLLERNERIVSWISPVGASVAQHIPAILYKDKFFTLSLRMQKAIYRHIRLKKGFKNEETMDGVVKLRIPDVLLKEKIRTQSRFDAMRRGVSTSSAMPKRKAEEGSSTTSERRERIKNTCTVSARMRQVVDQMIACDPELYQSALQQTTIFAFKSQQSEIISCFLQEMRRENSALYQDKPALLQVIGDAYDQSQSLYFGA